MAEGQVGQVLQQVFSAQKLVATVAKMLQHLFNARALFFVCGPAVIAEVKVCRATTKIKHGIGHTVVCGLNVQGAQSNGCVSCGLGGTLLHRELGKHRLSHQGGRQAALQAPAEGGQYFVLHLTRVVHRKRQVVAQKNAAPAPVDGQPQKPRVQLHRVKRVAGADFQGLPLDGLAQGEGSQFMLNATFLVGQAQAGAVTLAQGPLFNFGEDAGHHLGFGLVVAKVGLRFV